MTNPIPESELLINPDGSIYHLNLKPEQLASSIISVGDPDRVEQVSRYFDHIEFKKRKREFVTHTGTYKGKRITVMSTGMGTDNIEIFMTELDALVNIDLKNRIPKDFPVSLNIVRVGTSGSMQEDIETGSLLASVYGLGLDTLMCFYKLQASAFEKKIGEMVKYALSLPFTPYCTACSLPLLDKLGNGILTGNTVTCPGFFAPQGRSIRIKPSKPDIIQLLSQFNLNKFRFTNFEMETAGLYAMGRLLGHQVLSLNAIIANRVTGEFVKDPSEVVNKLIFHTLENI